MRKRKLGVGLLVGGMVLASGVPLMADAVADPATPATPVSIPAAVSKAVAEKGSAPVIVLLRGTQAVAQPDTKANGTQHASAVAREQAPVLNLLSTGNRATKVHAYKSFDMVSATVTAAGLASLAARPDVAEVVPDSTIKLADPTSSARAAASATGTAVTPPAGVCSTTTPQLNPQALQTTHTQSDDKSALTARSLGATGAGVKVAWLAEGIDVNNPDFIRPDGSKVFVDYQDFTGDGTSAPTAAGEAFLDASSIAAQGRETYDVANYSDLPSATPCKIRIEGVAPGASLVGLKVFGENELALNSGFLQAIDYAVDTDHVDVLSESFGTNAFPDTTTDLIRAADASAVAAGVSVVVSSGDAGITSTLGSPSTQPGVIAAGASTTYRIDLQDGYGGARFPGVKGYLNDNISSLSSGGTTERGSTVDLVAPGELNWTLCTADTQQYFDCADYTGKPSDVMASGGTSESAPLTAGGAALVIEAYRSTHGGASPSPALVKQILVSTADDIAAPGDQQGAGELDTYRAVLAARSIGTPDGAPKAQGNTLVTDSTQIDASAAPSTKVSRKITITNTGTTTQKVSVTGRTLGAYTAFKQTSVTLNAQSPTQVDWQGFADPYATTTFTVPSGASRLDAAITYQGASSALSARGRLTLVDPQGRLAAYSLPQGVGNYGDVQVARPVAGTWTAYIYSRPASGGGSLGTYVFGERTANYTSAGSVSASTLSLAPHTSGTVTYTTRTPATPSDRAESVVVRSSAGGTTIPVVLRSRIPLTASGTTFTGTLTGGNGREAGTGQTAYYQFDVPTGAAEINAQIALANNPHNPYFVSLVDPHGDQVALGSNEFQASLTSAPTIGLTAVVHALAPTAGTWDLIVNFAPTVSGTALSQPYSVTLDSQQQTASAPGLPTSASTSLPAGTGQVVNVKVTNHTKAPEAYFVDARTATTTSVALAGSGTTLALPATTEPTWVVPTGTTEVDTSMTSSVPAEFDFGPFFGDPDLESNSTGLTSAGSYVAPAVTQGYWYLGASEIGPYGAVGAPQGTATASMSVKTLGFDTAATSPTGDLWALSTNPSAALVKPVVVQPGASATIPVTITPSARVGTVVKGTLFLDDLASVTYAGVVPSANQVVALPYTYTVGRSSAPAVGTPQH